MKPGYGCQLAGILPDSAGATPAWAPDSSVAHFLMIRAKRIMFV